MHKVKILKSINGVNDGEIYPTHFAENAVAHIGDDLLSAFIAMGVVEIIDVVEGAPAEEDAIAQEPKITTEEPLETKPAKAVRETKPARKGK